MSNFGRAAGTIALLSFFAGCSMWSTTPDGQQDSATEHGSMFRTDSAAYHLVVTPAEKRVRITSYFTNTTGAPVYVPLCGSSALMRLEKRVGDAWEVAYRPSCTLEARSPIKIDAGATYRDTADVLEVRAPNGLPKFMVKEIPGIYRAIYGGFSSWNPSSTGGPPGELLPEQARTSNEFTIEP